MRRSSSGRQTASNSAIAVSNVAGDELAGLAWDLGAAYVLTPPQPRDALLSVVLGLMETARKE